MADFNAVSNSFASAPQSFTQKDRAEELRDARQSTSQFENKQLAQNETVAKDQRANSATTVFASTASSDTGAGRASVNAANSLETGSPAAQVSLQQTADAFEQQLQRAAVERNSRAREAPAEAQSNVQAREPRQADARETRSEPSSDNNREQVELQSPGSAPAPEARAETASGPSDTADTGGAARVVASEQERSESANTADAPERENAEDALGFGSATA